MKAKGRFVKNTAVLTVTALLLRGIGILFRVWLSGKIGAEGMGLYQLIISVYALISAFAGAGLSTAVTRLVTDDLAVGRKRAALRLLRRALLLSFLVGTALGVVLFFAADPVARYLLRDPRAVTALRVLCLSLPSLGLSSCFKGYFSARREVSVSARAQLVEQAVRVGGTMLLFSRLNAPTVGAACTAVMIGDTVAEWSACLYLSIGCALSRRRIPPAPRDTAPLPGSLKRLLGIALPITAGRYLSSGLRTAENLLVPAALARYAGSDSAGLSQFGILKGMVLPLLFFPFSLLSAISSLLIPEISEARVLHNDLRVRRAVERALHLTFLSSVLLGMLFTVLGDPLGRLLYHDATVGALLRVLAPLTPLMYLESMIDGILKGLGQQNRSLLYSLIDSALRILLVLWLVPRQGMKGFLMIMVISNLLTSLLNFSRLVRVTGTPVQWGRWIVRPLVAALFAGAVVLLLGRMAPTASDVVRLLVGGTVGTAAYCLWLLPLGALGREDVQGLFTRRVDKRPTETT